MRVPLPRLLLAASSLALTAAPAPPASAAEPFRYTDRSGRTHLVPVAPLPSFAGAPPTADAPPSLPLPVDPPGLPAGLTPDRPDARSPALLPSPGAPLPLDPRSLPHADLIGEAASYYSLPPALLLALVQVESRFNPRAVSRRGALGLTQLMPATALDLGVLEPFDPSQNVFGGARFLRSLLNEFDGQLALALAAYNAGPGAVRRHGGIPPVAETQSYVPAVIALYHAYQARLSAPETSR